MESEKLDTAQDLGSSKKKIHDFHIVSDTFSTFEGSHFGFLIKKSLSKSGENFASRKKECSSAFKTAAF